MVSRSKRTWFHELPVRQTDRFRRGVPEHHVELRVAEDEGLGLVDQGHLDGVAERLGNARAELEAAEACSQHQNSSLHCPIVSRRRPSS
jgi:hypothetical protein